RRFRLYSHEAHVLITDVANIVHEAIPLPVEFIAQSIAHVLLAVPVDLEPIGIVRGMGPMHVVAKEAPAHGVQDVRGCGRLMCFKGFADTLCDGELTPYGRRHESLEINFCNLAENFCEKLDALGREHPSVLPRL